jgi:hypothetical protein
MFQTTYKQIYKPSFTDIKVEQQKRRLEHMENSYIHFKIDKELKTELQIIALKQNTNITQVLTELIQEYVDENK